MSKARGKGEPTDAAPSRKPPQDLVAERAVPFLDGGARWRR